MVQAADFQNITRIGRNIQRGKWNRKRFTLEQITFWHPGKIGSLEKLEAAARLRSRSTAWVSGMQMARPRLFFCSKGTKIPGMYLKYQFGSENKTRIYILGTSGDPGSRGKTSLKRMEKQIQGQTWYFDPWTESYKLPGLQSGWSHPVDLDAVSPATERAVVPVWRSEMGSGWAISLYNTLRTLT